MEWDIPIAQSECERYYLENYVPVQVYLKCYTFLPSIETKNFTRQQKDLEAKINKYIDTKKSLIQAQLHKNQTRVSIIYHDGSLFTFDLKERLSYQEKSVWQGEIGEISEFVMNNFVIKNHKFLSAEGQDVRGKFIMNGEIQDSDGEWIGFYEQQNDKHFMKFSKFQVTSEGKIIASGQDDAGEFRIYGQIKDNKYQVTFIKEYVSWNIYYKGTINSERNQIIGNWGWNENESVDKFQIDNQTKSEVKVNIKYDNKDSSWIKLIGTFDSQQATLQGDEFEYSEDLSETFKSKTRFKLIGIECQNRAMQVFGSSDFKYSQFCDVKSSDSNQNVYICGNLRKAPQNSNYAITGYSQFLFDLINLDKNEINQTQNKKILQCYIPSSFKEQKDAKGNLQLPYYVLSPFFIDIRDQNDILFYTQMFYRDSNLNCRKMIFIQGKGLQLQQVNSQQNMILPQWPTTISENTTVQYPIIAYKSNSPLNNEIFVCNIMTNIPQKLINLDPFRFVKFLKTGLNPDQNLDSQSSEAINISIYFLVEHQGLYYLMYYRFFPIPIIKSIVEPDYFQNFQFRDQIYLVAGYINPNGNPLEISRDRLLTNKIQAVSMLQRPETDGVQIMIVLQLIQEIVCFNLTTQKFLYITSHPSMIELPIERGPDEQIYLAELSSTGSNEIHVLTFTEHEKYTKKTIFRSDNNQILSFSVKLNNDYQDTKGNSHYIYILDSMPRLKRIYTEGLQDVFDFIVDTTIDLNFHPNIIEITNYLTQTSWNKVMLHEKGIIGLNFGENENELIGTVLSTRSKLQYEQNLMGFANDRKLEMLSKNKYHSERSSSVRSIQTIPWISKNIFEIKESKVSYFLIQSQICSRRIDLMRADTVYALFDNLVLLGNSQIAIYLNYCAQYILFSQKDFLFQGVFSSGILTPLTHVFEGVQYFLETDDESEICQSVVKIDCTGLKTRIITDIEEKWIDFQTKCFSKQSYTQVQEIEYQKQAIHRHTQMFGTFQFWGGNKALIVKKQLTGQKIFINVLSFNEKLIQEKKSLKDYLLNSQMKSTKSNEQDSFRFYILDCQYWKDIDVEDSSNQILYTKDYLVIKFSKHIYFAQVKIINQVQKRIQNTYKTLDLDKRFSYMHKTKMGLVEFQLINIDFLSKSITENGFKILEVAEYDQKFVERASDKNNLIQISFSSAELAIIWDLDDNKQISSINNLADFSNQRSYIATGFVPHSYNIIDGEQQLDDIRFFNQNEDRSIVCMPRLDEKNSQIFRSFSAINLNDVLDIQECQENNKYISDIDEQTMVQTYNGLTFFQIFQGKSDYTKILYETIKTKGIQSQVNVDDQGNQSDNILIRKIYWTLTMPIIKDYFPYNQKNKWNNQNILRPNILQSSMFDNENQHMLDPLLRLLMLSSEFKLSNLVGSFQCFKQVFNIESSQINTFLTESYFENKQTKELTSIKWNPKHSLITFGSDYCYMSKDEILNRVQEKQLSKISHFGVRQLCCPKMFYKGEQKLLKTFPVSVKIIEIEWLSQNIKDLYIYLQQIDDDIIFGNELIKVLLEQQIYTNQLVFKVFIPYLVYMILSLVYYSIFVPSVPVVGGFFGDRNNQQQGGIRFSILIGAFSFLLIEIRQFFNDMQAYLSDPWNLLFIVANLLTIIIVISHGTQNQISSNDLIRLSSVAIILDWLMLIYWLRIFPSLAFYVTMITQTIIDISHFFLVFLMWITMFANACYTLNGMSQNINDANYEPTPPIWDPAFNAPFQDSMLNQYRIGLGDFDTSVYSTHPANILIFIYFILATFFTQVMFMNMLIAIMSETYSRVSEAKERSSLMERTRLYADFLWCIKLSKELEGMKYLYVVRPQQDTADLQEQESLSQIVQTKFQEISTSMISNFTSTNQHLSNKVHLILKENNEFKEKLKTIENNQEEMQQKQLIIQQKLDKILEQLVPVKKT